MVGVCEDTRLSVAALGTPFVAYLLDSKKVPTLTKPQLQIWLDTLASFSVFDEKACKSQPAMKKEYNKMLDAVRRLAICDRVTTGDVAVNFRTYGT